MYESVKIVCNDLVLWDLFASLLSNETFKYQKRINIELKKEQKIILNIKEERLSDFLVKPAPSKLDIIIIDSKYSSPERLSNSLKELLKENPFRFVLVINTNQFDNKIDQFFHGLIPVLQLNIEDSLYHQIIQQYIHNLAANPVHISYEEVWRQKILLQPNSLKPKLKLLEELSDFIHVTMSSLDSESISKTLKSQKNPKLNLQLQMLNFVNQQEQQFSLMDQKSQKNAFKKNSSQKNKTQIQNQNQAQNYNQILNQNLNQKNKSNTLNDFDLSSPDEESNHYTSSMHETQDQQSMNTNDYYSNMNSMHSNNFSQQIDQNQSSEMYIRPSIEDGTWTVKEQRNQDCDMLSKYSQQPDRQKYPGQKKQEKSNNSKTNQKSKKLPKNSEGIQRENLKSKLYDNKIANSHVNEWDHLMQQYPHKNNSHYNFK